MKTTEQNFYLKKWCFASNLLIKNAERRENEVKARVKSVIAARISRIQDSFAFPRRGKANEKLLESKNLFCESCSQRPYYYTEVISVF